MKCVYCQDWDFPDDEKLEDWKTCPNCDFPVKLTSWIETMQNRIRELEEENNQLQRKLKAINSSV